MSDASRDEDYVTFGDFETVVALARTRVLERLGAAQRENAEIEALAARVKALEQKLAAAGGR